MVIKTLVDTAINVIVILFDQHEQRLAALSHHTRIIILKRFSNTTEDFAALRNRLLDLLGTTARGIISLILEMMVKQEICTLKARPEMEQRQRIPRREKTLTACLRTIGYMFFRDLRTILSVYLSKRQS